MHLGPHINRRALSVPRFRQAVDTVAGPIFPLWRVCCGIAGLAEAGHKLERLRSSLSSPARALSRSLFLFLFLPLLSQGRRETGRQQAVNRPAGLDRPTL